MTIATIRDASRREATTVSYVNDSLAINFGCAVQSHKAKHIARNDKVSLTVISVLRQLGRNPAACPKSSVRGLSDAGAIVITTTDIHLRARIGAAVTRAFLSWHAGRAI